MEAFRIVAASAVARIDYRPAAVPAVAVHPLHLLVGRSGGWILIGWSDSK
jgi:hypothetical protein